MAHAARLISAIAGLLRLRRRYRRLGFRRRPPRGVPGAFRRAADIDAGAVAADDFRVEPLQHHGAAVERDDLPIVLAAGRPGRPDIVLAALTALEFQLLQLRIVGEVHHHAAIRSAIDDNRLAARGARGRLSAHQIFWPMEGAVSPAADDFLGANCRRYFGTGRGFRRRCRASRLIAGAAPQRQGTRRGRSRKPTVIAHPPAHRHPPRTLHWLDGRTPPKPHTRLLATPSPAVLLPDLAARVTESDPEEQEEANTGFYPPLLYSLLAQFLSHRPHRP